VPANKNSKDNEKPAVILKRKSHEGEEGHHGGVWKIAYADFMTAMMTFFLVMWLINSASKEKITQLANYFNPVKLSDRTPLSKGVSDNQKAEALTEKAAPDKPSKENGKPDAKPSAPPRQTDEESLFHNPFGVLTQLASQAETALAAAGVPKANPNILAAGGSNHDPFITDPIMSQPLNHAAPRPVREEDPEATVEAPPLLSKEMVAAQQGNAGSLNNEHSSAEQQANQEKAKTAARLEKDLQQLIEALPQSFRPGISAKATGEGTLLSLTDDTNFSMFKIASAEPSPQLVLLLEKVAGLISKYRGKIIIRGHTDGRPYAGDRNGNWRLSVNRATMTYYMLLRGKLDDGRFLALEGYGDRDLKNKADPLAGENRRIEILIKGADTP
jgi:chemotaxis protein MotB